MPKHLSLGKLRLAFIGAAVVIALLVGPSTLKGESYGVADLPPSAKPREMSVYLEASVIGTLTYVCSGTDVVGEMAWYLRASEARLLDSAQEQIGRSHFTYSGRPRVRVEPSWEDKSGGKWAGRVVGRGTLPANPDIGWHRYDVQSRNGDGPITEAKAVIRIGAWRTVPYAERCDKSRSGIEIRSQFTATDLFFK